MNGIPPEDRSLINRQHGVGCSFTSADEGTVSNSSYDYVIVGAGSAGCLLADRLGASGARVLVLEAGGSDRKPEVKAPAAFPNQFQTAIDWNYMSEPEPGLFGRRVFLPLPCFSARNSSAKAQ